MKKLRVEYENASAEQKRFLEQRYGKKVIERAIHDSYTNEWLEQFSKQCPHCKSHIQVRYKNSVNRVPTASLIYR